MTHACRVPPSNHVNHSVCRRRRRTSGDTEELAEATAEVDQTSLEVDNHRACVVLRDALAVGGIHQAGELGEPYSAISASMTLRLLVRLVDVRELSLANVMTEASECRWCEESLIWAAMVVANVRAPSTYPSIEPERSSTIATAKRREHPGSYSQGSFTFSTCASER